MANQLFGTAVFMKATKKKKKINIRYLKNISGINKQLARQKKEIDDLE